MIYVLNILLTVFWGLLLLRRTALHKKAFIIINSIQMVLLSGLRGLEVGADTKNYYDLYIYYRDNDWQVIFDQVSNFFGKFNYADRDMGYYIFTKIFSSVFPSYRIFLFAVIITFMTFLGIFLYRYSSDLMMSYVVFESFMFQFFGLTGIRQTLSVVLIVFIGYEFIRKKRLVAFLVVSLLAISFHASSIVFVPFYFIYGIKTNKIKYLLTVGVAIFILIVKKYASLLPMGLYGSRYSEITGITSYNFIFLMALVFVAMALLDNQILFLDKRNRVYIDATLISFILVESSIIFDLFFRLAWYYLPFLLLIIPSIINCFDYKSQRLLRALVVAGCILLLYKNNLTYSFL